MYFIVDLLKENKLKIFAFLCISIATSLLGVATLAFINTYLLRDDTNILIAYFLMLLLVFFACSIFVEISLSVFGQNFIFKMQRMMVKQILDTSFLQIDKIGKAKLLASLGNDIRTVSFGLLRFPDFIQSSILIVCTSIYLFYLSPRIFIFCGIWIICIFIVDHFFILKTYKYFRLSRESDDSLQHNYQDIIEGRKELTLNMFRSKLYYKSNFEKKAREKKYNNTMSSIMQILSSNWTNVSLLALVGLEFYFALHYKWSNLQNATTIAVAILFLRTPLVSVIGNFPTLLMAKVALDKISSLELSTYEKKFKIVKYDKSWKSIIFKDVSFSYDEKFTLQPTNLEIHKGELIFLIGKNGSGKSTLSMLLAGLIIPQNGSIYLDDLKIDKNNINLYRSLITAIFSDFHLFTQTIKDNGFAKSSNINYWINILELNDKVKIADNELSTTKLSTGQRKRLAMLIALLEERDILILDEWAADQDPLFRKFFYRKLLPLLKERGITIFTISHDDVYFDMADRIFLAQDGYVQELVGSNIEQIAKSAVDNF